MPVEDAAVGGVGCVGRCAVGAGEEAPIIRASAGSAGRLVVLLSVGEGEEAEDEESPEEKGREDSRSRMVARARLRRSWN